MVLMVVSWASDAVGGRLLSLDADAVRVICGLVKEEVAVVAAGFVAVAVVDALAPCSVAPILSLHLADFHHPFQQIP